MSEDSEEVTDNEVSGRDRECGTELLTSVMPTAKRGIEGENRGTPETDG